MRHARSPLAGTQRDLAASGGLDAAGAADAERALLFVVEVQEVLRLQHAAGKLGRAGQTGFFVDGEDELQRTVRDVLALHHGQRGGHADAVVGAQGGAVGLQPVAVAHEA